MKGGATMGSVRKTGETSRVGVGGHKARAYELRPRPLLCFPWRIIDGVRLGPGSYKQCGLVSSRVGLREHSLAGGYSVGEGQGGRLRRGDA